MFASFGCRGELLGLAGPDRDQLAREAEETVSAPPLPDCDLLAACPELALDPAGCVEDPALFEVTMLGEIAVDIGVIEAEAAALGDGEWYGVFPDPTGGCQHAIVAFSIDGGA